MTLADRVVVMNKGVIQQVGTPTEIYDHPANTFVASFIGSPAMNLVDGDDRGRRLRGAEACASRACPTDVSGPVTLGFRAEDATHRRRRRPDRGAGLLDRAARRGVDDQLPHRRRAGVGQGRQGIPRRDRRDRARRRSRRHLPPVRQDQRQADLGGQRRDGARTDGAAIADRDDAHDRTISSAASRKPTGPRTTPRSAPPSRRR